MKIHSPAHIVEFILEYIFLILKNKQTSNKTRIQKNPNKQATKQENKKSERNERRKEGNYGKKSISKK